jgi:hypothetical protein
MTTPFTRYDEMGGNTVTARTRTRRGRKRKRTKSSAVKTVTAAPDISLNLILVTNEVSRHARRSGKGFRALIRRSRGIG